MTSSLPRIAAFLFCVYQAEVNGEVIGAYDSYPGTTFNALGIQRVGVETMTFRTVRLPENDWISLLEVSDVHRSPAPTTKYL